MYFCPRVLCLSAIFLAATASDINSTVAAIEDAVDEGVFVHGGPPDNEDTKARFVARFVSAENYASFVQTSDINTVGDIPQINTLVMEFNSEEEAKEWAHGRDDIESFEEDILVYQQSMTESTPFGITMVNAPEIQYVAGSGIKMCIIDSGYLMGHEDLPNVNNGAAVTGRGDLCLEPTCDWDKDVTGHGSHVAGTILALGGNNVGVKGVVDTGDMPLHVVRVFGDTGSTYSSNVVTGMYDCEANGANVISMSLGSSSLSSAYPPAVTEILGRNDRILFVAAAGNAGNDSYGYPASMPEMVSVASITSSKERSYFSQYNDQVDIAAPGSSIISTVPPFSDSYGYKSGTSMATPHVSGVAAKVWSHNPSMTAMEVRNLLESTAEDLGTTGRDDFFGWGLVDAKAAYDGLPASCTDSPLKILTASLKRSAKTCDIIATKPNLCTRKKVKTHCPATCGECDTYGSVDSIGDFLWSRNVRNCAWVREMACTNFNLFTRLIQKDDIKNTCRKTHSMLYGNWNKAE